MIETLPTTPTEIPDETIDQDGFSAEDLERIDGAARGAEAVLDNALRHGEPRRDVVETDRGRKGFVEAGIPGGRMETLFNGTGEDAKPEEIDIHLRGEEGETHMIGVRFLENEKTLLFVDGDPARPEDVPSVAAVVERIVAEQNVDADSEPGDDEDANLGEQEMRTAMGELDAISAALGGLDFQLAQAQEKMLSAQAELGDIGESIGKVFEELVTMIKILEEELNKIANEQDEEKREAMKRDLQRKINEIAARLANLN